MSCPATTRSGAGSARAPASTSASADWILEGGAIDVDGTGLAVTTEQCLLNPNRNPYLSRGEIEARLAADLGIDRVLWLGSGLMNDHTDGHVDNLARFVARGRARHSRAGRSAIPTTAVYRDAANRARRFGLEVVPLPSPGRVTRGGEIIPASYMNFYIGNAAVVVPQYGAPNDEAAVAAIQALFPGPGGGRACAPTISSPAAAASTASASRCPHDRAQSRRAPARLRRRMSDENIANVSALVREAAGKGAKVVLPPELFEGPYFCRTEDEGHVRHRAAGRRPSRRAGDAQARRRARASTSRPASSRRTGRIIITASR